MERLEQLRVKDELNHAKRVEDDMYAKLWEEDRLAKAAREERDAKATYERNQEVLKVMIDNYEHHKHVISLTVVTFRVNVIIIKKN